MYSYGVSTVENMIVERKIAEFKDSILNSDTYFSYEETILEVKIIYHVSRETLKGEKPSFSDVSKEYIGQKGDILITRQSPFPGVIGIDQFISYYFGGHSALVVDNDEVIEVAGLGNGNIFDVITTSGDNPDHGYTQTVTRSTNYWNNPNFRSKTDPEYKYFKGYYRNEVIGIRPKNITDEQINAVIDYANQRVEENALYNYLFVLDNHNKFYCTDLVSRAYSSISKDILGTRKAFNLNQDGFIVSANDLILSKDTYMFFYRETIGDEIHMYFFE